MGEPRDVVIASMGILLVVAAIVSGILPRFRTWIGSVATNGGSSGSSPFATSINPLDPVTVGTGGDMIAGQYLSTEPPIHLFGTFQGDTFVPSDSRIGQFTVTQNQHYTGLPDTGSGWRSFGHQVIPDSVLADIYRTLGRTLPVTGSRPSVPA